MSTKWKGLYDVSNERKLHYRPISKWNNYHILYHSNRHSMSTPFASNLLNYDAIFARTPAVQDVFFSTLYWKRGVSIQDMEREPTSMFCTWSCVNSVTEWGYRYMSSDTMIQMCATRVSLNIEWYLCTGVVNSPFGNYVEDELWSSV